MICLTIQVLICFQVGLLKASLANSNREVEKLNIERFSKESEIMNLKEQHIRAQNDLEKELSSANDLLKV